MSEEDGIGTGCWRAFWRGFWDGLTAADVRRFFASAIRKG